MKKVSPDNEGSSDVEAGWGAELTQAVAGAAKEENQVAKQPPISNGVPLEMGLHPKTKKDEDSDEVGMVRVG